LSSLRPTFILACAFAALCACGKEESMHHAAAAFATAPASGREIGADLARISRLRIAFGHQSVGYNLVAGIDTLAREAHVPFTITETKSAFTAGPGLHHFTIARNEEPLTKLADFNAIMRGGLAESADIAMMKLCFVDFGKEVRPQPDALARAYIAELTRLAAQFPHTIFVPVTAPLMTVQSGLRAQIKKLLGTLPAGYEENERRQLFNRALRKRFGATGLLFDIAALEDDSGRSSVQFGGKAIETLNPAYTSDGGHLNALGQRVLGAALIHHLATLPARS